MASYTKTYRGDLGSFIAGKLWDKVKEWDDNRTIDESDADPIVKEAAKELKRNNDPNSIEVKDPSLREKVSNIFGVGIDSKIVRTEDKVDKLAGRVSVVAGGIADTQKLIVNQNQLLEDKFDQILELYGVQNKLRKEEIEDEKVKDEELKLEGIKQSGKGRQFAKRIGLPSSFGGFLGQLLWGQLKGVATRRILQPLKRMLYRRVILSNRRLRNAYKIARRLNPAKYWQKYSVKAASRQVYKTALSHVTDRFLKKQATNQVVKRGVKETTERVVAKEVGQQVFGTGSKRLGMKATVGKIPIVSLLLGAWFGGERALKGDWLGAGAEITSSILSTLPGKGTAASYAVDAMLLGRDIERAVTGKEDFDIGTEGASSVSSGNVHGTELIQSQSSAISTVVDPILTAVSLIGGSLLGVANAMGMKTDATSVILRKGIDVPQEISYVGNMRGGTKKVTTVSTTSFSDRLKLPGIKDKEYEYTAEKKDDGNKNGVNKTNKGTGGDPVSPSEKILGGKRSTIEFWSMQGIDKSGESGVDFSFRDYKNNYNLFPGEVVEVNRKYGERYGNVVIVRSKDPSNGKFFDSLYSHFPDGGINVRENQPVAEGQLLGKVGFVSVDVPGVPQMQPKNAGNMSGWHTSVDFFEPDSAQPYRNWVTIAKLVQSGNGSTPHGLLNRLKPEEPEQKETPTKEISDSLGTPPPLPPVPDNISSNISPVANNKSSVVQSGSSSMNDMKKSSSKGKTSIVYITQTIETASSPNIPTGSDYGSMGETGVDLHIKRLAG